MCGGPAPVMALRDALFGEKWEDAQVLTRELSACYDGLVPQGNFEVWHQDKIAFMKARFAAGRERPALGQQGQFGTASDEPAGRGGKPGIEAALLAKDSVDPPGRHRLLETFQCQTAERAQPERTA